MTRARLVRLALGLAVAGSASACGEPGDPRGAAPASSHAVAAAPFEDARSVRAAADALWRAIDAYDVRAFAALCVERGDGAPAPVEPDAVAGTVKDLHERYGLRPRRLEEPRAEAGASASIVTRLGDGDDAIDLTFSRTAGGWRLSSIHTADAPPAADDAAAPVGGAPAPR